ncbi:MAG: T9SS C-terminal target domain-containing protein [Candidatus Zixiibacteriota bacterium]|nr:MAG: T9SS C-terminal target domain-containing protein [candidate division Zixibacteria bacterium]
MVYTDVFNSAGNFYGSGLPAGTGILTTVNANGDSCDVYGNTVLEPQFVDPFNQGFQLESDSPCINAGDPALPPDPDNTVADMGAIPFFHESAVPGSQPGRPADFRLLGAHPNPFNPVTALSFSLPVPGYVSLRVYDTAGREVRTLVNGWRTAGSQEATFDGSGLPSGVYLVRLEMGDFIQTQKLVLLK